MGARVSFQQENDMLRSGGGWAGGVSRENRQWSEHSGEAVSPEKLGDSRASVRS